MSKYTRSNKINHYHDSSSTNMKVNASPKQRRASYNFVRLAPIISDYGEIIIDNDRIDISSSSSVSKFFHPKHLNTGYAEADLLLKRGDELKSSRKRDGNSSAARVNYWRTNLSQLKQLAFISYLILATMIISFEVKGVASLNCYYCSSVDNPGCDESFSGRANFTDTDCEKHIGRPAKVCRKLVQYIEDKKVVIRSCGYIDDHEGKEPKAMCYKRSGTFAIMMESCNCYEDNCNHSASLVPSKSLLLTLISASSFGLLSALMAFCLSQVINIRSTPTFIVS